VRQDVRVSVTPRLHCAFYLESFVKMLSIIEDAVVACRRVWHYRGSVEWASLLTVEYNSCSMHINIRRDVNL